MNVPDDWNTYWTTCDRGHRYHLSDGGCDECASEDEEEQRQQDEDRERRPKRRTR